MKHALIAAGVLWVAAGAAMAQSEPATPSAGSGTAPVILNAPTPAAEPYAGQKPASAVPAANATSAPKPSPTVAPATTAEPAPAAVNTPATPTATAPAAEGAAAAAKAAASEAKPHVPEGPQVKPIAKDGATGKDGTTSKDTAAAKSDAKSESKAGASGATAAVSGDSVPTVAKPEPPKPTLLVSIDLTKQKMAVTENGVSKYTWSISSGRTGYITPRGTFRPVWMSKMWYSRKYDYAPMPHAIFFHGGTAIHGTDSVYALGRPASHGCVRLAPNNAATLYRLVTKHGKPMTRITVFGTPKQAPVAARDEQDRRMPARQRRYQDEPWWAEDGDDYPPLPPRRRMYSDRYYDRYDRPRYAYPRRQRRNLREYDYYDDYED
jgi:lipoprotein-anchoring transpeptidase ErfK/SrfK